MDSGSQPVRRRVWATRPVPAPLCRPRLDRAERCAHRRTATSPMSVRPRISSRSTRAHYSGITGLEVPEKPPTPAAFHARTLNRYVVPVVNPMTLCEVAVEMKYLGPCDTPPT